MTYAPKPLESTKPLEVGDVVRKTSGYKFNGEVRAVFKTKVGVERYVVESNDAPGLLHIFNKDQLEPDPAPPKPLEVGERVRLRHRGTELGEVLWVKDKHVSVLYEGQDWPTDEDECDLERVPQ